MTEQLRKEYRQIQDARWAGDRKMIDYCCKKADIVYRIRGYLAEIEKPRIQTDFCFGYGFCGISDQEDEDRANHMADHARTNEDYFIRENLKDLDRWIDALGDDHMAAYCTGGNHNLVGLNFCKKWDIEQQQRFAEHGNYKMFVLTDEERKEIAGYYGIEKDRFTKRLKTYLKRYGLSKVWSWTYLCD